MARCEFCKNDIDKGTGKLVIQKTGKQLWFCSSKCEKKMLKFKQSPLKTKWLTKKKKA